VFFKEYINAIGSTEEKVKMLEKKKDCENPGKPWVHNGVK